MTDEGVGPSAEPLPWSPLGPRPSGFVQRNAWFPNPEWIRAWGFQGRGPVMTKCGFCKAAFHWWLGLFLGAERTPQKLNGLKNRPFF